MTEEHRKAELLEETLQQVRSRVPAAEVESAVRFINEYYRQVDAKDLLARSADDLYGAAMSHLQFLQRTRGQLPRIRAYNPTVPEHGWQSPHTIVEIVNNDMPFLVDSVSHEIGRQGLTIHLIIHPVMRVDRDDGGAVKIPDDEAVTGSLLSVIHAEVDRHTDKAALEALQDGLAKVLGDVRAAVDDWPTMVTRIGEVIAEVEATPPPQEPNQTTEDCAFLRWIADGNFTLLGYRYYALTVAGDTEVLQVVPDSGLGILRGEAPEGGSDGFAMLPPEAHVQADPPHLLVVAKSDVRASVHRPSYMDYLGIKRFDESGAVIGEHRFLGLFTSSAYNTNPTDIPLLRRKLFNVIERAEFLPHSYAAKSLLTALEQYPRDELFQLDFEQLYATAIGIVNLGERQKTRLFMRRDPWGRFFSCLIFTPRERYDTALRERMQQVLMEALGGTSCEHSVQISESVLARLLLIVRTDPHASPSYDVKELEERLGQTARRWEDDLAQALISRSGEEAGNLSMRKYGSGFPTAYREDHSAREAVYDIELMDTLRDGQSIAVSLYAPLESAAGNLRFKILHSGAPVPLSESLPMLEDMGLKVIDEHPYRVARDGDDPVWIHDFGLQLGAGVELDIDAARIPFQDAFREVWKGEVASDKFNRLILAGGLDWREVKVLRAYAKYMRQAGITFSQAYIESTLATYPAIARTLVEMFETRLDPAFEGDRAAATLAKEQEIRAALTAVSSLDDDRILRQFMAVINATLRTNYYRRGAAGELRSYISFKFDPKKIPGLPEPRPMYEIFVFSPRFEGIHLRGGMVARGGLRWSDRMEDFRTEVLGLVKAQVVKNAVIVPTGSKGGFVLKKPPLSGDREALMKEAITCYQMFLRGLLDITDNLDRGQVVPPPDVVRHDGDDPYLVVAADKGTATFSDTANGVAGEYGFWLDDAFASGGSAGYDHKKMGITARGAWESVKRHFRELGHDTQSEPFRVVGVGDMSGDVFGNGMLLSRHIRLVAAFDHRHIFIDPEPDCATSYAERERLFELPRSSWADYDSALISAGGGIWPRTAKSIALTDEMRRALDVEGESLTPAELIRAILMAPVDLFYNGGIGTYVKATDETNAQVGDRATDALRINADQLRCRVVAEGGNLGFTQRGRIQFAERGGLIYTDAIDNSAGVDCSDHEVNIKILLNGVVADGELTRKQRDVLLAEMTDEVAALVLRDNIQQTQILSVMAARSPGLLDAQARYMRTLEKAGRLNRTIEFLPDDEEIAARARAGRGLTLPELSVLLAYSKIDLYEKVVASEAPDEALVAALLPAYFPTPLRERFAAGIRNHPLRREIIATAAINEMVNRMDSTFAFRLTEDIGASAGQVVLAYTAIRDAYQLGETWEEIEGLDPSVPAAMHNALLSDVSRLTVRATQWLLRRPAYLGDLGQAVALFRATIQELSGHLEELMLGSERGAFNEAVKAYVDAGVPGTVARRVVSLVPLYCALDIAEIAAASKRSPALVGQAYFELISRLDLFWLNQQIGRLGSDNHWQSLARDALRDDLLGIAANLTARVFSECHSEDCDITALIATWESSRAPQLRRYRQVVAEMVPIAQLDMPMASVALRELRGMVRT